MKKNKCAISILPWRPFPFRAVMLCLHLLVVYPAIANAQKVQPTTYGLSLPVPIKPVSLPVPITAVPTVERFFPFVLTIDTFGFISDYVAGDIADSSILSSADSLLRTLQFVPGRFQGTKRTMFVPVFFHSWPRDSRLRIKYPVDHSMRVSDLALYEQGLKLNGVEPPTIDMFPSYYCDYIAGDTMPLYPFMLARLSLDAQGSPLAIDKIISTAGTFTDQLISVINWGSYQPMRVSGEPKESSSFLLISLYPQVNYPSKTLTLVFSDSATAQERWRVRILSDTIGQFMAPPLPKLYQNLTYTAVDSLAVTHQIVSVRVRIDTLGTINIGRISSLSTSLKKLVAVILKRQRFYPALNYSGKPVDFPGLIYMDFKSSGIVRINPDWL